MYADAGLTGRSLAAGQLSLTFDDGPGDSDDPDAGPRTLELAEYLAGEGVPACFFVVGKHVVERPGLVGRLRELGHLVGNHTYRHPNLVDLHELGGDVAAEVAATDAVIGPAGSDAPTPFRPPYGAWSPQVASALNGAVFQAARHVGPVMWDVDGRDWAAWDGGTSPEGCAAEYLRAIEAAGRGIVLMHDSTADSDALRDRNQTFEMVRLLLPRLRSRGFRFLPLQEVPDIAQVWAGDVLLLRDPRSETVTVRTGGHGGAWLATDRAWLAAEGGGGGRMVLSTERETRFELIPVSAARAAFRAPTGHFLTRCRTTGVLSATGSRLGPSETFECTVVPGSVDPTRPPELETLHPLRTIRHLPAGEGMTGHGLRQL